MAILTVLSRSKLMLWELDLTNTLDLNLATL